MKLATMERPFFARSFEEKLRKVQDLGFDGFEVDGKVLVDRFDEIKKAVRTTGVPVSSVCGGYRGWIGDFDAEKRAQAIQDIRVILLRSAEVGAIGLVAPAAFGMFSRKLSRLAPPRSEQEDRQVLLESLNELNEAARSSGSLLLLEPLNRYEDHMINRLEDAITLIREGNFAAVRVIADFFHMNIEEPDIAASIRSAGDLIRHVHLADSNRLQPGQGHTDFKAGFQALQEIGYTGFMTLECGLSDNGDPERAYRETARYLRACMA